MCCRSQQEGKLNVYRTAPLEELETLHQADRFLVECLKIYRLPGRVAGMLYRVSFEETISALEEVSPFRSSAMM